MTFRFGRRRRTLALVAGGVAAASTLTLATAATAAPAAGTPAVSAAPSAAVTVTGLVHHRLALTLPALRSLPRHSVTVTFQTGSGPQTHTYAGPLLYDIMQKADPVVRPAVKNDLLRDYVAATAVATDGYQAIVSWGEIDPSYEGKQVLLAVNEDGVPLTRGQLVLVVPGDTAGGRYVAGVTNLRLGSADS